MARTPKENLILKLQVTQRQLGRPVPTKTKADKQRTETARLTKVGLFNQHLSEAQALGLVVAGEWPQRFADTGFCGMVQFICSWSDVADRNRQLLNLLERATDPAKPDPAKPDPAKDSGTSSS